MRKKCSACGKNKDIEKFGFDRPLKRRSKCKICHYQVWKKWSQNNRKRISGYRKANFKRLKSEVFSHYGIVCQCCGESEPIFLCIDHPKGGGEKHRKSIGKRSGEPFYRWLRKNNFPQDYRVLCYNCNMATRLNRPCPHKKS